MRTQFSISSRAEADLTHQYRWYLNNANGAVAECFLSAFNATVERLAQVPSLGRPRHFRTIELQGIRSLMIGSGFNSHLVFYRLVGDIMSIERVMHGARDLERRLAEPPEDSLDT
jgi:toxin ParE1/3/4